MGSPHNAQDRHDAMWDWGGRAVQRYVHDHYPLDAQILDVGAGWGKYRDLLDDYPNVDACEIWEPYVKAEHLRDRYRHVWQMDIVELASSGSHASRYDVAIFGDVLEHLTRPRAKVALNGFRSSVVVVPFRYAQGEEDGNPYEKHWQADLTPELMRLVYPELQEIEIEWHRTRPYKGLYVTTETPL